jgi:hypothetical protein
MSVGNTLVPIQFELMRVAQAETDSAEMLDTMLAAELPAYIIRMSEEAVSVEQAKAQHSHCVETIAGCLGKLFEDRDIRFQQAMDGAPDGSKYPFVGFGQEPKGKLHHDMTAILKDKDPDLAYSRTDLIVNTTVSGGGRVYAAAFGTNFGAVVRLSGPRAVAAPHHPHSHFLDGLANPEVINPTVLEGSLHAGDTIVIANRPSYGSWHRFDTDESLGIRKITSTEVEDWPFIED